MHILNPRILDPENQYDFGEINAHLAQERSLREFERLKGWSHGPLGNYIKKEIDAGRLREDVRPRMVQYRRVENGGK